jgi:hypothetical protein
VITVKYSGEIFCCILALENCMDLDKFLKNKNSKKKIVGG